MDHSLNKKHSKCWASIEEFGLNERNTKQEDVCVTNDPLGQTHSFASSDHHFHLKIALFCEILKIVDGRTHHVRK